MTTSKTLLETIIERRNFFQERLVDNMVDVIYYTKQMAKHKPDTQERVDAVKSAEQAQKNVDNDQVLLESFDELIESIGKSEPGKDK